MSGFVLDASAVLAVLLTEDGAENVLRQVGGASISSVNRCEVGTRLLDLGGSVEESNRRFNGLALDVIPFDAEQAADAAALRLVTRHRGLSLGDRACLALARAQGRAVLTGDRNWEGLKVGVVIELIR